VRVTIVGAGVVGLTTALELCRAGHTVDVVARDTTPGTTSDVAAAIWYPYRVGPHDAVADWAAQSYRIFAELARDEATGVVIRQGTEMFRDRVAEPAWRAGATDLESVSGGDHFAGGYRFSAPVIDMSRYLPWLQASVERGGVGIERAVVTDLGALVDEGRVVVNCAGLGARELADDPTVEPVRGQVVRVRQIGITEWYDEDTPGALTYIVPRLDDIVLGGSAERGRWDVEVDASETEAIMRRCIAVEPRLADAQVLSTAVGLRPWRPSVRLATETDRPVVHCYGHGGAGVTLSWGCAREVVGLVDAYDRKG
jgi:D-amino-acid oxidase